jgi:hypothetical protein
MRVQRAVLLCGVLATFVTGTIRAQSAQSLSVQGSGLYLNLFGNAFEGADAGYGFEAQVRYTPSAFSIGAGLQYTSHPVAGQDKHAKLVGGFIEPRYVFSTSSSTFFPYLSARGYVVRLTSENPATTIKITSTGIAANGGGGVLVRVASRVNIDLGATYGYIKFNDFKIKNQTNGIEGTSDGNHGSNIVGRVGLTFGL